MTARIERSGCLDGQAQVTFDHTLPTAERVVDDARQRKTEVAARARPTDATDRQLAIAADQFVNTTPTGPTVAAGYPSVGVLMAGLAMLIAFAWLTWYPIWALLLVAVSVAVIWPSPHTAETPQPRIQISAVMPGESY